MLLRIAYWARVLAFSLTCGGCALVGLPNVRSCFVRETTDALSAALDEKQWAGRLILLGDFGTGREGRNRRVAQALERYLSQVPPLPTEVLLLGDNFYPRGLVGREGRCGSSDSAASHSAIRDQLAEVLGPYEWLRKRQLPVYAVAGNHDHGCGTEAIANQQDIDRFLGPVERWGSTWRFYSGPPQEIVLGNLLQIVILDSEPMISDSKFLKQSTDRLAELLAEGQGRYAWQLVAAHHPLLTAGTHDGAWPDGLRRPSSFLLFPSHFFASLYLPPFADLNQDAYTFRYQRYRREVLRAIHRSGASVSLVLSGHDHNLQLLTAEDTQQPLQLIAGSGAYCSPVQWRRNLLFAAAQNGFAVLKYAAGALGVEFYTVAPCVGTPSCGIAEDAAPHRAYATVIHSTKIVGAQTVRLPQPGDGRAKEAALLRR